MKLWTVRWEPVDPVEAETAEEAARLMYERMTTGVERPVLAVLETGFARRESKIVDLDAVDLGEDPKL